MKKLLLLLVALFASLTATAQYVAIYASPYSSGMVQVGTDNNMGPLLDGSSMTIVEAGQTVYFSFQPFSGYKFNGIRYKNLSSDDVTELPDGIYSFIMPDFTGDNFWVSIYIDFVPDEEPPVVTGVDINEENFPDENFRNWLLSQSYGADAVITESEMMSIGKIDAQSCGIHDLTGIEYFTQLYELNVSNPYGTSQENWNTITSLNVSNKTYLRKLVVYNNQLESIDLSRCPDLRNLDCSDNALTQLDVTDCPLLSMLYCVNNQLTELDLSENPHLAVFSCTGNQLTELDVTSNVDLEQLFCENNKLTSVNVINLNKLMLFNCNDNLLTALDVAGCTQLFQLYFYNNQINGQAMEDLVNSLETPPNGGYMVVVDLDNEAEQNAMTKAQVATARAKHWSVEGISEEDFYPYEGIDDVTVIMGDVDQDGNVTIADVTMLIDYLLNDVTAAPAEADMDGDSTVAIGDVTAIIDYLLNSI